MMQQDKPVSETPKQPAEPLWGAAPTITKSSQRAGKQHANTKGASGFLVPSVASLESAPEEQFQSD